MKMGNLVKKTRDFAAPFRVDGSRKFKLSDFDPDDTLDYDDEDKPRAKEALADGVEALAELQDMLYAQDRWAVLLIFQAMDAAGKDGAIKHVMSGVNPQGCQVYSFKAPTSEDLDHDYLWRCMKCLPERGRIGIFNRSYYEETLVVRVHPEFLAKQKLPPKLVDEGHLEGALPGHPRLRALPRAQRRRSSASSSCTSRRRSRRSASSSGSTTRRRTGSSRPNDAAGARALGRLHGGLRGDDPRTRRPKDAPWYVVPADNKWFTRVVVAAAVIDALASLDLAYPKIGPAQKRELDAARQALAGKK